MGHQSHFWLSSSNAGLLPLYSYGSCLASGSSLPAHMFNLFHCSSKGRIPILREFVLFDWSVRVLESKAHYLPSPYLLPHVVKQARDLLGSLS